MAVVLPLDKGKPNKNDVSNFQPVSILSTFLKIYETVIKSQLLHGMENVFSPQISAYWKKYISQHVLTLFKSNPYKIEVMITFLIDMPKLPNFGHMTTSTI